MEAIGKKLRSNTPILLTLPSIILVLLIAIYPIIFAFSMSLTNRRLNASEYEFTWFANYVDMFTDMTFWNALMRTIKYTGLTVAVEMLLGFGLALLLNQALRCRTFFRIIMLTFRTNQRNNSIYYILTQFFPVPLPTE